MVLRHQVTGHAMGVTEHTPGPSLPPDIAGQLALRLSARIDLVFALGLELAFGSTRPSHGIAAGCGEQHPPLRAISQLGLRVDL